MDPLIEELLHIFVNNCKSSSSEILQLATAECLGELGAIEPSFQRQNFSNQKEFPKTIHSDEFAMMALTQLCRSYQYKNDPKYTDSLSLAIQEILKSRGVTQQNRLEHDVWNAIPEKMRQVMESLLISTYSAKQSPVSDVHPIFWNIAQTASDWAVRWANVLISRITDFTTKNLLESIKLSMKHNQYTTSMFLPYILLHNLESSDPATHHLIIEEIQRVLDVVMDKDYIGRENNEGRKPLYVKLFDFKPIESKKKLPENSIKSVAIKVAKIIFEAFDFLENHRRTHTASPSCNVITKFLSSFDMEELAVGNFKCGEYARAMIYLEAKMKSKNCTPEEFQEKLSFLTNIYAKLGSSDAVEGIQSLKTSEWSLEEKVLISNVTGNHRDSAACFEKMMQSGAAKIEHIQSMLHSLISLDQPETALLVYENMIQKLDESQQNKLSHELKAEPLWRLSRFDELEELVKDKKVAQSTSWGVRCGELLLKFRSDDGNNVLEELKSTRLAMMKNLKISGSEQTAYGKNYREIVNLHLISEFEKTEEAVGQIKKSPADSEKIIKNLINTWNARMEFVQKNASIEEPIYSLHRIIFNETKTRLQSNFGDDQIHKLNELIDGEIGKLWIESTKLACKNEMFQQAQIYILNAEAYEPKDLFLEKAKLHWIKKDQKNAFKTLELGTKNLVLNRRVEDLTMEEKKIYLRGKLMIAQYNAEAVNLDFESNKKLFLEARQGLSTVATEKLYLVTAEYMDRFYCTEDATKFARIGEPKHMIEVMQSYYKSMARGSEYVFQSMPRFLSIWLDTTANFLKHKDSQADLVRINNYVNDCTDRLAINFFYTAFSQLISRICHESADTFAVLKTILVKLVINYPQQSLWFLTPMLKSSHSQRAKKCKVIFTDSRLSDARTQGLLHDFNSLIERINKLTQLQVNDRSRFLSIERAAPELVSFIAAKQSTIIMPFQCNLQLIRVCKQNKFKFADQLVHIFKIKDHVDILSSLQKPKKVTMIGDDGKEYVMLFKNDDDLRIDFRFQEISSVVKEFLNKDPESRQRQLATRTYSVVPLGEKCGLIGKCNNLFIFTIH